MRIQWKIWLLLSLLLVPATGWGAKMLPIRKVRAGEPPFAVLETLSRHNDRLVSPDPDQKPAPAATPHIIWLADCDARMQASLLYPESINRIYPVRNFGNQLLLSAGAIDYGVNQLHIPVLLITGNTDSAGIRLLGTGTDLLSPDLRRDLDHLKEALVERQSQTAEPRERTELELVEQNVDFQVAQAMKRYAERIGNGRLVVVGAVLDLANRYDRGVNRLVLINLNGETDPAKMRAMSHLVRLDRRLLGMVGRKR